MADDLAIRIDTFLRHATWMTEHEIAGQARLLLRECLDRLEPEHCDSSMERAIRAVAQMRTLGEIEMLPRKHQD